MPPPRNYTLPTGVEAHRLPNGFLSLSGALVELLVQARSTYNWPAGTGATQSQLTILDLEGRVAELMLGLNEENAHNIVTSISKWAGNNAQAHNAIIQAAPDAQVKMVNSLQLFNSPDGLAYAIDSLCDLPGIRLVIASKIFRFCCPSIGAAVDRHTSYFFNSLEVISPEGRRDRSTNFRREWSNATNSPSRLAIYTNTGYHRNRDEFFSVYLPLLRSMADSLNAISALQMSIWRPIIGERATGQDNVPAPRSISIILKVKF